MGVGDHVPEAAVRALSLTQPWGWAILHAGKDVENRTRPLMKRAPGRVLLHAAKGIGCEAAYGNDAEAIVYEAKCHGLSVTVPLASMIERGGIIGIATLGAPLPPDLFTAAGPPWCKRRWHFHEQWGFPVSDARPLPFVPCKGKLGFWRVDAVRDAELVRALVSAGYPLSPCVSCGELCLWDCEACR